MFQFTETTLGATPIQPFISTNAAGQSIGFGMIDGIYSAFVRGPDGSETIVKAPDSAFGPLVSIGGGAPTNGFYCMPYAINSHGVVVGHFVDTAGVTHGFIDDHGHYTTIDVPGASATWVQGIDDSGNIFGSYQPQGGVEQKFLASSRHPFDGNAIGDNYSVMDSTLHTKTEMGGVWANGTNDLILVSTENLNVVPHLANVFVHTGDGNDSINVSATGGNNTLDGGRGSNYLVGGKGHDSFITDVTKLTANEWSTIVHFGQGDMLTVWGMARNTVALMNRHAGATFEVKSNGFTGDVTLAGMTANQVSHMHMSFGQTGGVDYMKLSA